MNLLNRRLIDAATGRVPRLIVTMPPRHGKSMLTSHFFPAWFLGTYPDKRVLLAGYEAEFASSWGRKARDVLEEYGPSVFGVKVRKDSAAANRWDIEGHDGGMMTAGVGGPLTGKGANLLIIDDPVKNSEEASSPVIRQRTWDWFVSSAYTRLEPGGAVVLVQTRWNEDDLAGRLLAQASAGGERWELLRLPALAEKGDILGRAEGEALWPERYNVEALESIQRTMSAHWFGALYQQRPAPVEGGLFQPAWFPIVDTLPPMTGKVRYWDVAASDGKGDWTAGVLMGVDHAKCYHVLDVQRVQASPADVEQLIRRTAESDGKEVRIRMEQEPGSAGLTVLSHYTRNVLPGYAFAGDRVTGPKALRCEPFAAQAQLHNVKLRRAAWNAAFLAELGTFPHGAHDDQVDAAAGAFSALTEKRPKFFIHVIGDDGPPVSPALRRVLGGGRR